MKSFREAVMNEIPSCGRGVKIERAQPMPSDKQERRDLLGVYKQKQEGKYRVGVPVPMHCLSVKECRQLADMANKYSGGEICLIVEQNAILPHVDESELENLFKEACFNGNKAAV